MESLYIADLLAGKEDRIGKYYYCFDPTILTGYEPGLTLQSTTSTLSLPAKPRFQLPTSLSLNFSIYTTLQTMASTEFSCKHGNTALLNFQNYHTWKSALTVYLRAENAFEIVLGNEDPPAANASFNVRESYQRRRGKALSMLYSSTDQSIRDIIDKLPEQHPAQIWTLLDQRCNTAASVSSRFATRRTFLLTAMKEGTPVANYISTLIGLQRQVAGTDQAISDIDLLTHLLSTLTASFYTFVDIATQQMEGMTIDLITTRLVEYENSLANRNAKVGATPNTAGTLTTGNALAASSGYKNGKNGRYGKERGSGKHSRKPYDRNSNKDLECYYCLKPGHRVRDCATKKKAEEKQKERDERRGKQGKSASGYNAFADDTGVHGLTVSLSATAVAEIAAFKALSSSERSTSSHSAFSVTKPDNSNIWIVDSGASHHLTPNRSAFNRDLRPFPEPIPVNIADGSTCFAMGIGSIDLQLDCGIPLRVEALYVPDFGVSLISVRQLAKAGTSVLFGPDNCYLWSRGKMAELPLGIVQTGSDTYTLLGTVRSDQVQANSANSAKSANPEDLRMWHRRLAHLSYGGLRLLLPKELYSEKESTKAVCDICAKAKAKEIFQRKDPVRRATKPLELIHSDLCGPITPVSQSGCRYYILYIDDFSRFSWISFLRTKTAAEICKVFREFKALVELKFSARITRFRCDNGKGEYDNDAFRAILSENGISFEPAPPYTQHKNGVSERMIQTHNAKARAMILDCSNRLPPSMWAEAVYTANYLHARSPTSANKGMTPYEKLYGSRPKIEHLRRFGCRAYRTLPAVQRSHGKFGARAEVLIMLGHVHDSTTIWRFWDPVGRRITHASNVRFDEADSTEADTAEVNGNVDTTADAEAVYGSNSETVATTPVRAGLGEPFQVEDDFDASTMFSDSLGVPSRAVESVAQDPADGDVQEHAPEPRSGRYDLRKRPRAVAHRTWVEEEPMDSADPVSYRKLLSIQGLALGGLMPSLKSYSLWARTLRGTMSGRKTFQPVSIPLAPSGSSRPNSFPGAEFGTRPG